MNTKHVYIKFYDLFQPFPLALGDREPATTGGVRSMLTDPTVVNAEFPALSAHVPVTD